MELKQKKLLKKLNDKKNKRNISEATEDDTKEEMSVFEFINETLITKSSFKNRF
jgi:hypothetical protein